jgi:twitching motility protein PilT
MEMVLEAAESGHLVLTSMNTVSVAKTVERMVSAFGQCEQTSIRSRLARTFRYMVSQRLIPRKDGTGRIAIVEMLKSHPHTQSCMEVNDASGENLLQAMRDGSSEGMQYFDGELEKLVRAGIVDSDTAMMYATDPQELRQTLAV